MTEFKTREDKTYSECRKSSEIMSVFLNSLSKKASIFDVVAI